MNWLKVQFDLGDIRAEPIEQALLELGAVAIEYADAGDKPIIEPEPRTVPLWEDIRMAALFDEEISETTVLLAIAKSIAPARVPQVHLSIIEERNWVADFQQELRPTRFGSNLWVCPPDTPCPDGQGVTITMEPGLGFGTGSHPTTAMCLDWLASQPVRDKSVLDIGCGSGILSIAGLALGAARVTAVDIDAQALTATRKNAQHNRCLERLRICPVAELNPAESFDLVVANLLSDTLISLEPAVRRHSRPGTKIALSGILTSQITVVSEAYGHWVDLDPLDNRLEWAILCGTVV